jgi:tRNA pseudouridine38-40 synthase
VLNAVWKQEPPYLIFEIKAQAFLYHMVRRLVFMQVMIAQGKLHISDLLRLLNNGLSIGESKMEEIHSPKSMVHGLAPAQGLILVEVYYPPETVCLDEDTE